jgi:uncharacterized protein
VGVGLLMIAGGAAAGLFGSLLGLGGGVLIVPLLTLVFGLDLREAVGVSLVCVIMTSSVAAGVYLERHVANLRLGMRLELFTAIGALIGGSIAFLIDERLLSVLFAVLLVYVAISMLRSSEQPASDDETVATARDEVVADEAADRHSPASATPPGTAAEVTTPAAAATTAVSAASDDTPGYEIRNFGFGVVGATGAGVVSALLGVGGGIVKVPLMHLAMGVPLRVSTATSNLMVGITAAASAVIYVVHGEVDPYVAGPTAIGVFLGASVGSRISHRIDLRVLRLLFVVVLLVTAVQMLLRVVG